MASRHLVTLLAKCKTSDGTVKYEIRVFTECLLHVTQMEEPLLEFRDVDASQA